MGHMSDQMHRPGVCYLLTVFGNSVGRVRRRRWDCYDSNLPNGCHLIVGPHLWCRGNGRRLLLGWASPSVIHSEAKAPEVCSCFATTGVLSAWMQSDSRRQLVCKSTNELRWVRPTFHDQESV